MSKVGRRGKEERWEESRKQKSGIFEEIKKIKFQKMKGYKCLTFGKFFQMLQSLIENVHILHKKDTEIILKVLWEEKSEI